jgi:hypothetical protein
MLYLHCGRCIRHCNVLRPIKITQQFVLRIQLRGVLRNCLVKSFLRHPSSSVCWLVPAVSYLVTIITITDLQLFSRVVNDVSWVTGVCNVCLISAKTASPIIRCITYPTSCKDKRKHVQWSGSWRCHCTECYFLSNAALSFTGLLNKSQGGVNYFARYTDEL